LNEPQQDGQRERLEKQRKEWFCDWSIATKEVECATIVFSLVINNIWLLVPLPKGRKPISCKWVFKIKHGVDGEIEFYKAKFMAKSFTQTFGVNYNETFAPIAKFVSIHCILALTAIENMEIHQMDVKTSFHLVLSKKFFQL
jgi:hypothetical protein